MVFDETNFKRLVLAGGKSTRLGTPKHSVQRPDGTTFLQHGVNVLRAAAPVPTTVYVSLAQESVLEPAATTRGADATEIILDRDPNHGTESAGPTAGLLAAHQQFPDATWIVIACDYPMLTTEAIVTLQRAFIPPVTCFQNVSGFLEPLLGIWSPAALSRLAEKTARGIRGPTSTITDLHGHTIKPPQGCENWLLNVNSATELEGAMDMLRN